MRRSVLYDAVRTARAAGLAVTRADRLAGRPRTGAVLGELAEWPRWPALPPADRERIWRIAALVSARDRLGELIDGTTLRALAAAVGEPAFEAVFALPPGGDAALPPATMLGESGRRMAEAALPPALAAAMGTGGGDRAAAMDVAAAEAIAA